MALSLSTIVKPAEKFTVDGEEFELLGMEHLSDSDEAEVIALYSRHTLLAIDLESTSAVAKGMVIAERLKATRLAILCKLTTMPKEIAIKLPDREQVRLLTALQEKDVPEDEDEDGLNPGTGVQGEFTYPD